jgi:ferrous-iron efflux pump FieF
VRPHPLAVVIAVKLAVALATGSRAVLASAVDSLGDAVVSGMNLWMMRQAAEPPDEGHPWGHGKAEALASLVQATVLAGVVAGVGWGAIHALVTGGGAMPDTGPALGVMLVSMVASFAISSFLARAARQTGSLVIGVDAVHYRMDLLTGAAVLVGLVATRLSGNASADAVASLLVSFLMVKDVWGVGKEAVDELMDRPLPPQEVERIEAELRSMGEPVRGWHDLRTRRAGPLRFVQVHVVLAAELPFAEAHAATHAVEARLRAVLPYVDAIVHADVEGEDDAAGGANPVPAHRPLTAPE